MSRPVFVRKLTKAEEAQMTRLIRSNEDARIVRRAQMIRLSAGGAAAYGGGVESGLREWVAAGGNARYLALPHST